RGGRARGERRAHPPVYGTALERRFVVLFVLGGDGRQVADGLRSDGTRGTRRTDGTGTADATAEHSTTGRGDLDRPADRRLDALDVVLLLTLPLADREDHANGLAGERVGDLLHGRVRREERGLQPERGHVAEPRLQGALIDGPVSAARREHRVPENGAPARRPTLDLEANLDHLLAVLRQHRLGGVDDDVILARRERLEAAAELLDEVSEVDTFGHTSHLS